MTTLSPLQIGSLCIADPVLLAPMSGVTDMPFRRLVKSFGVGLVVSEMIASREMLHDSRRTRELLRRSDDEKPIAVQLAGCEADVMAEAAKINEQEGVALIDINMGCPAKKVVNGQAGSALMRDERLAGAILKSVVDAVNVPVTLKMRTGWDRDSRNAPAIARIAEEVGIQALSVHGRSRECRYHGPIDYETIARVKWSVSIPVIANGDIDSPQTALQVLRTTGADAVMVGRAAQGQPWLLGRIKHLLEAAGVNLNLTPEQVARHQGSHTGLFLANEAAGMAA